MQGFRVSPDTVSHVAYISARPFY